MDLPPSAPSMGYSGVRLARVQARFDYIVDRSQYQYWNGLTWVQDVNADMLEAVPQAQGGLWGSSADLISATVATQPRSEISVAFDSYANRFVMMLTNVARAQVELWQAPAVTGPWSWVAVNGQLPNYNGFTFDGSGAIVYSPFTSDQVLSNGGGDVYFLLSELSAGNNQPPPSNLYNVGLWHYAVTRAITPFCPLQ
jgi:hypothetical protein